MQAIDVIKKPILTEKSTFQMNEEGKYTFLVDRRATKTDVKQAVESLYRVHVAKVTTQTRGGRVRKLRYGWVQDKVSKKATVTLREGERIELF
jgi:large subunit ribosomal protein L23